MDVVADRPDRPEGWPRNGLTFRVGELCRTGNEWCTIRSPHPHGPQCDVGCPCTTSWRTDG